MIRRIAWSGPLAVGVAALVAQLWGSPAPHERGGQPGGALFASAAGQAGQPGPGAVPGVDGPVPQAADGTPAQPFSLSPVEVRSTADIAAEQAARDAAEAGQPRVPRARPEKEYDGRRGLPQDPASPPIARWPEGAPALAPGPDTGLEVTPGVTIEGPTLADTLAFPPDTMGDAGPTQYFVALNGELQVYSRSTGDPEPGLHFEPDTFFSSSVRGGASTTDPRIRYDRLSDRWFITYITVAIPNRLVLAVSSGGVITPSTTWAFYGLTNTVRNDIDEPCLADYATLGIDAHALYIGVNQFCGATVNDAAFSTTSGYVVNKASLLAAPPASAVVSLFSPLLMGSAGPYTPQGVDNPDHAATEGYFVGVDAFTFGRLSLIRVSNPGSTPSASSPIAVTVASTVLPINVPHAGAVKPLDAIDDRLMNAVVRNGRLYTTHAVGVNASGASTGADRTGVRWYELEGLSGAASVRQFGTIVDGAASNPLFYWVPSINTNSAGDVVVGYSTAGAAAFAGAAVSHRRASDPLGSMQPGVEVVAGAAAYTPAADTSGASYRWGDYSMVSVDPTDDFRFWTAQMYGRTTGAYGTRVVQLTVTGGAAPLPAALADAYAVPGNSTFTVVAPGVLANDNSNGGGALSAVLVATVSHGTLALNPDGGFSYTPAQGYQGPDGFTYQATNATGASLAATVSFVVSGGAPTTVGDSYYTPIDTPLSVPPPGVLANDNSNGGGAMAAELVAGPSQGVLALNPDGGFTYTPNAGFAGEDGFTYRAVNSLGAGTTAAVRLFVLAEGTPEPPGGLYVSAMSGNRVTLRFTPPAGGPIATGYILKGGANPGEVYASLPTGGTLPIFTFDAPPGAYYIRLHTISGALESPPSNEIRLFVNVPAPPSAPAALLGVADGTTVGLTWRNTFAGGVPQRLQLDVTGSIVTTIPLGLGQGFSMAGVPAGTYTLALRAANAAGISPPSNSLTLSFPGTCGGPPQAPANMVAYRVGNVVTVLWESPDGGPAPTGYALAVSGALNQVFTTTGRGLAGAVGSGSYTLAVFGFNACGNGPAAPPALVVVP